MFLGIIVKLKHYCKKIHKYFFTAPVFYKSEASLKIQNRRQTKKNIFWKS